ncbi:DUF6090 family protein [Flagellimonas meridianipacifica]|uniref:Uncharacterized protein n=1 Tax=Flagellimonas meridianipacifica TaxID=1080225 RepID=A0A2T0M9F4_9FLAO|nr:hypothetical protein CLV81_2564 [Allomuricauda pacifica]
MAENKISQYLFYAAGEIVLVVVGILLALQINNWNEKRKLEESILNLFGVLQDELQQNINTANSSIEMGLELDARFRLVFETELSVEQMSDLGALIELGTFSENFLDDNLAKIIEKEKEIPLEYKNLIPHLKELQRRITSQRKWESIILDMVYEHRTEYSKKLDWLHKRDSLSLAKSTEFMLTDAIFKNQLKNWSRTMLNENFWDMSLIQSSSVFLLWKIKEIWNSDVNISFEEFMMKNGMNPMKSFECNEELFVTNPTYEFRINTTIFNNTSERVTLDVVNQTKDEIFTISIPANDLFINELNLGANQNYGYLKLKKDDKCSQIYAFAPNGFLVLN